MNIGKLESNERTVNVRDVIEIIDEQVEFLKQQNGAGAIMGLLKIFDSENVKKVINTNNSMIEQLTDMRMKVLELGI